MKKPGPGVEAHSPLCSPRMRVPFRYSERPRCTLFNLCEPVRIGLGCKSPLK